MSSSNYIVASHAQKTTIDVWRWDKKDPLIRFPAKEELSVLRLSPNNGSICVAASKKGSLSVWQVVNGQMIGELEQAHYMEITDVDISSSSDLLITGGKDCKVKVWILSE